MTGSEAQGEALRKRMTAALKREFVPALLNLGFTGTYPRYRWQTATTLEFVAIFYDKAGARLFRSSWSSARIRAGTRTRGGAR